MSTIIRQIISTDNAAKPIAPFNVCFSQAIVVNQTVYLSGCIGINKETSKLVDGGVVPETIKTLENMKGILEAAGSGIDKVVKVTIFVDDMNDFAKVNEEYMKVFTTNFPARSCVQMAKLPMNAKVEIEVIALVG
ncbi:rutC family protein UK114-like isoform X1 [Bradysia coprophila]|uniref:rutC family protein UK114-like isoform X1 n=1 Tax=Bradysia coprophila TaxID=38358 RepID=UPI00187D8893|nr:rutC family protein UK114-like isoform X1 [Bradysia coprophila]